MIKNKINQSAQPEHKHRNIFKYYDKLICVFQIANDKINDDKQKNYS